MSHRLFAGASLAAYFWAGFEWGHDQLVSGSCDEEEFPADTSTADTIDDESLFHSVRAEALSLDPGRLLSDAHRLCCRDS